MALSMVNLPGGSTIGFEIGVRGPGMVASSEFPGGDPESVSRLPGDLPLSLFTFGGAPRSRTHAPFVAHSEWDYRQLIWYLGFVQR